MKFIDTHIHLGLSLDGGHGRPEDLVKLMNKIGMSHAVIFATDEKDKGATFEAPNTRILEISKKFSKQIIGFTRIVPTAGQAAINEFQRCLNLGARGLKLKTSDGFHVEDSRMILDLIPRTKKHFPVIMHTAHNEHSQPSLWENVIADYPWLNFIMGHGAKDHYRKCAEVANRNPNAFIETSTLSLHRTAKIYKITGPDKLLFGSDFPYSHPEIELKKYKLAIPNKKHLKQVLHENAERILGL